MGCRPVIREANTIADELAKKGARENDFLQPGLTPNDLAFGSC